MKLNQLTAALIKNKRVLLRADYNVPLKKSGKHWLVADDTRLKSSLPTIKFLLKNKAKVIICSHLGRPGGKIVAKYRLDPVAEQLAKLINRPVKKINNPAGSEAEQAVSAMKAGELIMLENTRFDPGEKTNDQRFARQLARLADVYVNEALAVSHRAHASIVAVTDHLPAAAGLGLVKEVATLENLIADPKRPFVAVVGGAKISDKVEAIRNLSKIADIVLVGGGVANNFLKADGVEVYHSYLEEPKTDKSQQTLAFVGVAENLIQETKTEKMLLNGYIPLPKILYPSDVIATNNLTKPTQYKEIMLTNGNNHQEKKHWMFVDIGSKTQKLYRDIILQAKTVFWNGPMGVFENQHFAGGTKAVAQAIAKVKGQTVVGGGDTIRAIKELKLDQHFDYISAAGGAALELLGGKLLPGLKPLLAK